MMKPNLILLPSVLTILALTPVAVAGGAHGGHEGTEGDGLPVEFQGFDSGCPAGRAMCFQADDVRLSSLEPGQDVSVTFLNKGGLRHEWMATTVDRMDPQHKATDHDAGVAGIHAVAPGAKGNTTFTVPADAAGLYFWCGEPGHEQLGMWTQTGSAVEAEGNAPLPAYLGAAAAVGALWFARRRGR